MKRHASARELLTRVEDVLCLKPRLAERGRRMAPRHPLVEREPGVLDQVAAILQMGRGYQHVSIYLDAGTLLVRRGMAGTSTNCTSMKYGEGLVGAAAQDGQTRVIPDVSADTTYRRVLDTTRSELVVSLKIGGRILGVLNAESDRINAFSYDDRVLAGEVARSVAQYLTSAGRFLLLEARESVAFGLV